MANKEQKDKDRHNNKKKQSPKSFKQFQEDEELKPKHIPSNNKEIQVIYPVDQEKF